MPLVRLSLSQSYESSVAVRASGAVHDAMVETIDVPPADRFATIRRCSEEEMVWDRGFLDVDRSDRAVFVEITLAVGRSDDKKRALFAAIARNLAAIGAREQDVLIVLTETTRVNWSFGNGVAQYVPAAAAS